MRCLVGEVLYDFPSPNYGTIEKGFEYTESLIERWKHHPLVQIAVEPHSLFTCSPHLLNKANELALAHDIPLILHLAETADEVRQRSGHDTGKVPLSTCLPWGFWAPPHRGPLCARGFIRSQKTLARTQVRSFTTPRAI